MPDSPSSIILDRSKYFRENDPEAIYELYAATSELHRLFTSIEDYAAHFSAISLKCFHAGETIVRETIRGNLAEVTYVEHFEEEGEMVHYYSKCTFRKIDGIWKIMKEKKERVTHPNG